MAILDGRRLVVLTTLLVVASAWAQTPPPQSPNLAADTGESYSLDANGFVDALLKASARFRFPMGVEWVKSADTLKPIHLSWTHSTVTDVIQTVVSTQAGYEWRMEDGVVHVFQRNLMEDPRNPLNVIIKSFDQKPETVGWANNDLWVMVSKVVRHPEWQGIGGSVLGYPGEPVFSFAAEDVPARSILNEIVTAGLSTTAPGMQRIWVATFPDQPTLTRIGYLEVVPTFAPNQSQPFWDLLRWGDGPSPHMLDFVNFFGVITQAGENQFEILTNPNADPQSSYKKEAKQVVLTPGTVFEVSARQDLAAGRGVQVVGLDLHNGTIQATRVTVYVGNRPTRQGNAPVVLPNGRILR